MQCFLCKQDPISQVWRCKKTYDVDMIYMRAIGLLSRDEPPTKIICISAAQHVQIKQVEQLAKGERPHEVKKDPIPYLRIYDGGESTR